MSDDPGEDERIVLSMDRTTARDLYNMFWDLDEHWAAGPEVPYRPREVRARLGVVIQ